MTNPSDPVVASNRGRVRRWIIRLAIVLVAVEVVYVIAANVFLRSGKLLDLINKKPEKMEITWDSAFTTLPGVATVENFELRTQTRKDQVYVRVAEADARISLLKLALKTIHIRGVDARDVDFRYRQRLDRPPKPGREDLSRPEPKDVEFWPEIPGYSNPPDPKPEEIYEIKRKKRPWTIKITGADVEGPIAVALNGVRIESDGTAGGGVTVKPRRSITIHRGRLGLEAARVSIGPDVVTDGLAIEADIEIDRFPAKGAKLADILGGISGELSIVGQVGDRAAVRHVITPGVWTRGAGDLAVHLDLKDGVLREGSRYELESDAFEIGIMALEATGSATVKGSTDREGGAHVTTADIDVGEFVFTDPADGSVSVSGSGMTLDAVWENLSIAGHVPARDVNLAIPTAQIHDIGALDALIPEQATLRLESGTGEVTAALEVADRIGSGSVDIVAEEIVLRSDATPLHGDLEVHAVLAEGDLESRRFDLSGTTIRLDDIVDETASERKQQQLEAWFGEIGFERARVNFTKPIRAEGRVALQLYDTRPIMATLKKLGAGPKWLSMAPNIKNVGGEVDVVVAPEQAGFTDLGLTGDGFEALGWMVVRGGDTNGRLFARFKGVKAGVSIVEGKAKVHLSKPRVWFDEQPKGPIP